MRKVLAIVGTGLLLSCSVAPASGQDANPPSPVPDAAVDINAIEP